MAIQAPESVVRAGSPRSDTTLRRRRPSRFLKFAAVGASGYAVNLLVFGLLVHLAGASVAAAAVVSFVFAVGNNYLWNRLWTFRDARAEGAVQQGLRFLLVSLCTLGANLLLLHALLPLGDVPAQALAIVLVTPLSYAGNRLWSFRPFAPSEPDDELLVRGSVPDEVVRAVVCVPTYNERDNLEPLLRTLGGALGPDDRVLVIDDASPDGTGLLADVLARELGYVDVLHRSGKSGLGRAYVAGFRHALALGAELVVQLDADFSHDPRDVARLLEASETADVVIGSRYVAGGSSAGLGPLRRLLSRGGSLYARILLGLPVRDLTGGFKCYRREVIESIDLDSIESSGYAFQIETTYRAARAGFSVAEVPIAFGERSVGESKMHPGIALEAARLVPALRLAGWRAALARSGRLSGYATVAAWWVGSRMIVLVGVLVAQIVRWPRHGWYPSLSEQPFALLRAWDGRWYTMVAERGYLLIPHHQSDAAFFPLYPILIQLLHGVGLSRFAAGAVLANVGFLLGLVALYELARTWFDEAGARRTAVYAAIYPFGFVFSMLYPEALALATMALAGAFAARGRWRAAGIAAATAAMLRPEGAFVVLPIAVLVVRRWRSLPFAERGRALFAAAAAPAAIAGLAAYQKVAVGDPLAFSHAQEQWGRWFSIDGARRAVWELTHAAQLDREWLWRDFGFLVAYVLLLVVAWRARVPLAWVAVGALLVLLPLESGSVTSIGRFGLLALPVYGGLAWLGRRPWVDRTLRTAGPLLLGLGSATILFHWP